MVHLVYCNHTGKTDDVVVGTGNPYNYEKSRF